MRLNSGDMMCTQPKVQNVFFSPHLISLLHPCSSIMDLNIGAPLWLAARGKGRIHIPANSSSSSDQDSDRVNTSLHGTIHGLDFTSSARVVFMGHGADEQCCGYVRHRSR